MAPDTTAAADADADCEVMASVDGDPRRFVIADLCRDEAWLSVPLEDAAALEAWR